MEGALPEKKKSVGLGVFLILIMVPGVIMLAFGAKGALERHHQKQYYQTVKGVIKEVFVHEGENGNTYSAKYYYEVDGKGYTIKDSVSTSKAPQAGRTVSVHYDPDAPGEAFVERRISTYGLLLLLGLMFTFIPLIIFLAEFTSTGGRVKETLQGLLIGVLFTALGFGLLFGVKPGGMSGVFLFLFGCLGVYISGYGIYQIFAGKPSD